MKDINFTEQFPEVHLIDGLFQLIAGVVMFFKEAWRLSKLCFFCCGEYPYGVQRLFSGFFAADFSLGYGHRNRIAYYLWRLQNDLIHPEECEACGC